MAAQFPQYEVSPHLDPLPDPMIRLCFKHPSVETRLTCSHCETPICPKCMVICEVGMKCNKCTSKTISHVVKAEWRDWLCGGLSSMVIGLIFGFIVTRLIFGFSYYLLLLSFWAGKWAGGLMHRCARFKMARSVLHVITGSCLLGLLLGLMPVILPFMAVLLEGQQSLSDWAYYTLLIELGSSVAFLIGLQTNFR